MPLVSIGQAERGGIAPRAQCPQAHRVPLDDGSDQVRTTGSHLRPGRSLQELAPFPLRQAHSRKVKGSANRKKSAQRLARLH